MSASPRQSRTLWLAAISTFLWTLSFYQLVYQPWSHSDTYASSSPTEQQSHSCTDPLHSTQNSTLGFQKIFVINLRTRPNRRDAFALAAQSTGLDVEFVDGITEDVDDKTLPPHEAGFKLPQGYVRSWRAHLNVVRRIVEQNIQSALILEDDSDWDLRIKSQMSDFARASGRLLHSQPIPPAESSNKTKREEGHELCEDSMALAHHEATLSHQTSAHDLSFSRRDFEAHMGPPLASPYGDLNNWDLLWLGHCGTHFPKPDENDNIIPLSRVPYLDSTVPESQHIKIQFGDDQLVTQYPNHTHVVHHLAGNACTLAYGLSLPGAKRMLLDMAVNRFDEVLDLMMTEMCEGSKGWKKRTCLSVQPQLFQHHRPVGPKSAQSDISSHSGEYRHTAFSRNIRWSTRVNLDKLVDGEGDYVDTFPDGAEAVELGF